MPNQEQAQKRICFNVDLQKKRFINEKLNWGDVQKIYETLTDQLIELLDEHDAEIVRAGIVSKSVSLAQLIDFNKNKDGNATE